LAIAQTWPVQTEGEGKDMGYDNDNIFARILRGELPCHKVYEDADTFAFLDIMPRSDGHLLVIPKTPARNLLDASPVQMAAVMATVQRLSRAALRAFAADGVTIQQFNEEAGGQEVFHLHFHVLPRLKGQSLRPPGIMAEADVLKAQAAKLRDVLGKG
jgi:histidine triad (HIT) family protein